jgi:hypothetical protein
MTEAALSSDPDAALGKLTVEDVSDVQSALLNCHATGEMM